jgi:hypothetical protein
MYSALIGAFCAAAIFATVTTVRHLANRADPAIVRPAKNVVPVPGTVLRNRSPSAHL